MWSNFYETAARHETKRTAHVWSCSISNYPPPRFRFLMLLVVCCVCDWAAAQNVPAPTPPTITILRATPAIFLPPTSDPMPEIILKRGGKIQISMTISVTGNPTPNCLFQLVKGVGSGSKTILVAGPPKNGEYSLTWTVTEADIDAVFLFSAETEPARSQMERQVRIKAATEPIPRTNGFHRVHLRQPKTWWPWWQPWP